MSYYNLASYKTKIDSKDTIARKIDGSPIRELKIRPENFLNRSTAIYAASGGGKTTIIRDIIRTIGDFISLCFVWSPTEDQNLGFQDIVPRASIFTEFEPKDIDEMITSIWQRQKASVITYKKATKSKVLVDLFGIVAKSKDKLKLEGICKTREKITRAFDRTIDTCHPEEKGYYEEEKKIIIDNLNLIQTEFFRKVINKRKRKLKHRKLSEDEQFCVDNLGFSPAICLVFDDCAHALPIANQKKPNFRNLFLAGRHNYITVLIAVHNRANLDKTINDNISRAIFCSKQVASLASNRIDSASKSDLSEFKHNITSIFNSSVEHRKMVYIGNSPDPFRWIKAKKIDFEEDEDKRKYVGSRYVIKFLKSVESNNDEIPTNNPYAKMFGIA